MSINTPEELRTLSQQIEDAHNRLLSINNEYARCQKMKMSEESTIAELQNLRIDNLEAVKTLTSKKESLQIELNVLMEKRENLVSKVEEAQTALAVIIKDTDLKREEIKNTIKDFNVLSSEFSNKKIELDRREKEIEKIEAEVLEKQDRIKDLISQIK
jgi:chromosome segregation ATPase